MSTIIVSVININCKYGLKENEMKVMHDLPCQAALFFHFARKFP